MKKLFDKKISLVKQLNEVGHDLDNLVVQEYGFHYSETDDDKIIDTLDYGRSLITYDEFHRRMMLYKEDFDNGVPFRTIV